MARRFALRPRLARASAALGAAGLATLLVAAPAHAATAPAPGTNLLTNGTLEAPMTEGATPTGWNPVNLDNETSPYDTSFSDFDANGQYPPPAGTPNASGYAPELYYEAGSSTGSEGFGAQQTSATFGSVTQANDPQISYAAAPTYLPGTTSVSYAGSIVQVDVTSGGKTYTLRYFTPWAASSGTYSGAPANTATTHYITEQSTGLAKGTWTRLAPRDLNADLKASFGLTTYSVADVTLGEVEGTTATYPYPNMTSYMTDITMAEGTNTTVPPAATPEAPVAVALPLAAVALVGGAVVLGRRRRKA